MGSSINSLGWEELNTAGAPLNLIMSVGVVGVGMSCMLGVQFLKNPEESSTAGIAAGTGAGN